MIQAAVLLQRANGLQSQSDGPLFYFCSDQSIQDPPDGLDEYLEMIVGQRPGPVPVCQVVSQLLGKLQLKTFAAPAAIAKIGAVNARQ